MLNGGEIIIVLFESVAFRLSEKARQFSFLIGLLICWIPGCRAIGLDAVWCWKNAWFALVLWAMILVVIPILKRLVPSRSKELFQTNDPTRNA